MSIVRPWLAGGVAECGKKCDGALRSPGFGVLQRWGRPCGPAPVGRSRLVIVSRLHIGRKRGIQTHSESVDVLRQWTNAECGLGVCGTGDG
jgi:hypothetical protein